MALQGVSPAKIGKPAHNAIENAYKAFDLAGTLANIYGSSPTLFGTKAVNYDPISAISSQPLLNSASYWRNMGNLGIGNQGTLGY